MRRASPIAVRIGIPLLVLLLLRPPGGLAQPAASSDDRFIAGYAHAVLERVLGLRGAAVRVDRGVVTVDAPGLDAAAASRVSAALRDIPGAARVVITGTGGWPPAAAGRPPAAAPPAARPPGPSDTGGGRAPAVAGAPGGRAAAVAGMAPAPSGAGGRPEPLPTGFLPGGRLFAPLAADPRWPHLEGRVSRILSGGRFGDRRLRNAGAGSIGESLVLYRAGAPWGGQWEAGAHAGVFPLFDLDSESLDLINADFVVGGFGAWRRGSFSALARLAHQSSHLGDEFVLSDGAERVNLSFERLDVKLSWDEETLRVYGGPGVLLRADPGGLDRWSVQAGAEVRLRPLAMRLRPLLAVDAQAHEYAGWDPGVSVRGGLELGDRRGPALQLLLHYFNGPAPDGQFFREDLEYIGIGLHGRF